MTIAIKGNSGERHQMREALRGRLVAFAAERRVLKSRRGRDETGREVRRQPSGPWTRPRLYPQHLPVERSRIGFTGGGESRRVSHNTQASGEKGFAHLGKLAESSFSEYCRSRHDSNVVAVPPLVDGMAAMRRFCPSPRP
jgi:hypothetical protein